MIPFKIQILYPPLLFVSRNPRRRMQASRSCTRLFTRLVASRVAARCQRSSPLTSAAKPDQLILPQGTTLPHVVTLTSKCSFISQTGFPIYQGVLLVEM